MCCQPIEMELRVRRATGHCRELVTRDAEIVRRKGRQTAEVALITGAGSGIGKATALAFLRTDFA